MRSAERLDESCDSSEAASSVNTATEVILGGTRVDLTDRDAVLAQIEQTLGTGHVPRGTQRFAVASANLDHIFHFGTHGSSRDEFERGCVQWLTLLDGAPLAVRASFLTARRWRRVPGSELIYPILDLAQRNHRSVGFLGGSATMHVALRERLAQIYPGLRVSGCWSPHRSAVTDPVAAGLLADEIRAAAVDVLIVGLGKPRQEVWIEHYAERSGAMLLLAFGASADFLAGTIRRAPRLLQITGMEWLFRLAREPRRLARRYLYEDLRAMRWLARDSGMPARNRPA